ncbi:MAG: hypothetical protein ACFB10_01440 [Salibacteraceae bacterium]
MINKENYEAYLLDYLEGTLALELVAELMVFLEAHPDLKAELDEDMLPTLEPPVAPAVDKSKLIKQILAVGSINESNYEAFLIREVEGALSDSEQEDLEAFMAANPALKKDRTYYQNTQLKADANEVFDQKVLLEQQIVATANIHEDNFEEQLIASREGWLSAAEQQELETFMQLNPGLEADRKYLNKVYLQADATLVYPGKSELKKTAIIPLWQQQRTWMAAAASVAVLLLAYWQWSPSADALYEPLGVGTNTGIAEETNGETWVRSFAFVASQPSAVEKSDWVLPVRNTAHQPVLTQPGEPKNTTIAPIQLALVKPLPGPRNVTEFLSNPQQEVAALPNDVIMGFQENDRPVIADNAPEEPYTILEFCTKMFRAKVLGKQDEDQARRNLDRLDLYEAGVVGANRIFKTDFEMVEEKDTSKKQTILKFVSNRFNFRKRLRNRE